MNRTLPLLALLIACKGEQQTETDDDPPTVVVGECQLDEECIAGLICEGAECIPGDRDNSFDEATPIRLNETFQGFIEPPGDIDHFVYESLGPEWIRINTTNSGDPIDSLDTVVQVFAENGAEHARADNFATGRVNTFDSVAILYLPYAGTWYITVEDVSTHYEDAFDSPRGGEDFEYTVEMIPFSNGALEPDSKLLPNEVIELPGGSTIVTFGIVLEEPGDSDWLVIDPPFAGEPLEVWGTPTPGSDAQPLVNLYHREDDVLVASKANIGTEGICSYFNPLDELYTLEATDLIGGGSSDHWYVVYIRTYEPDARHPVFGDAIWETEVEPNDDALTASAPTVVNEMNPSGSTFDVQFFEGVLSSGTDVDTYAVPHGANLQMSVRCWDNDYGSEIDIAVNVFDSTGTSVTPTDQGLEPTSNGYYVHNAIVPADSYTVQFSAEDGFGGPSAYYRCVVYQTAFDVDVGTLP